jgi:hypothetical protein
VPDSFYIPLGDGRFASTEHTAGPWDPGLQHAGPPSALLARAIEQLPQPWAGAVTRMSLDILGPVPVAEVAVSTTVLRTGRSVELVSAELSAAGRVAVRATAWRIRTTELELPELPAQDAAAVPPFATGSAPAAPEWIGGYLQAMEWRVGGGSWMQPGPATVWGRMRYPLVSDEEPTGLQRVMAIADSGNGVSFVLPVDAWFFINPDLTMHLAHEPQGEWICLDAVTTVDERGFGLANSRLFDRDRMIGRGAQSLFIGPR